MNSLVAANRKSSPSSRPFLRLAAAAVAAIGLLAQVRAAGSGSVTLAWNENPEPDISGYQLKYGTASGSYTNTVEAGDSTSATATGLNEGVTYYFVVLARNTANQYSAPSSEAVYTVPGEPNTAPSAGSFTLTVPEDGQIAATLTGSDPQANSLTYGIVGAPSKGSLTGTAPNLTYRPNLNANGSDSFSYRTNDGVLDSPIATVSITITPVNDAPVAAAKSASVAEDGSVGITLSGTDVDGDPLSYVVVTGPSKGSLSGTAPNLTYRPNANLTGGDSFTYRVFDGALNSATATVSITINPSNDPPVANSRSAGTDEDTSVPIALSGSDPDGNPLTFSIVSPPANGTLSGSPPNVVYTPGLNFNGTDSFGFRVNDGSVNSGIATVSIAVAAVNDAPVANPGSATTQPNGTVSVAVSGSDVDGDPLTYSIVSQPSHGTLSGSAPNWSYTPENGYKGDDSFTYRVNDGTVNSPAATVAIVIGGNRKPVAHPKSLVSVQNKAIVIPIEGTDADGDKLTYRVTSQPENGKVVGRSPKFKFVPEKGWTGDASFTYVANDGTDDSTPATVDIKVKLKNRRPVANAISLTANQNAANPFTLTGSDSDEDPLTFVIARAPRNGTIHGTSPNFIYTPKQGFKGSDLFTFYVTDGQLKSKAVKVVINVINPNNRAPVALSMEIDSPARKGVVIFPEATDADSDPLTFRIVSQPAVGKVGYRRGKFSYKPGKFEGTVSFTYLANDGVLDSAPATITLNIADTAAAPAAAASLSVGEPPMPTLALRAVPGMVMLDLTGTPGETYMLETSSNLTDWDDDREVAIDASGAVTLEIAVPEDSPRGFFRLRTP